MHITSAIDCDGAYLCVKIICKAAQLRAEGRSIKDLISTLGAPAESEEIRYTITGDNFADYVKKVLEDFTAFANADPRFHIVSPNYEGVCISFDDDEVQGWMLIRMSLHNPVIPINLESRTAGGTKVIMDRLNPFIAEHDRLEK